MFLDFAGKFSYPYLACGSKQSISTLTRPRKMGDEKKEQNQAGNGNKIL